MGTQAEFNAWSKAKGQSVEQLISDARPPGWKFWIGEPRRIAAVEWLGEKGSGSAQAVDYLSGVFDADSSPKVRSRAADSLAKILPTAAAPSESKLDSIVSAFMEKLKPGPADEEAISILRAPGQLVDVPASRAARAEVPVRSFLQQRIQRPSVNARVVLWGSFALAKLCNDSEAAGPVRALGTVLATNEMDEARNAIKATPAVHGLDATSLAGVLASSAGDIDDDLIVTKALSAIVDQEPAASGSKTVLLTQAMRAATAVMRRKLEALEAISLMGRRASPLVEQVRQLRNTTTSKKVKERADKALSSIQ